MSISRGISPLAILQPLSDCVGVGGASDRSRAISVMSAILSMILYSKATIIILEISEAILYVRWEQQVHRFARCAQSYIQRF